MLFGSPGDAGSTVPHLSWPPACTRLAPSLSALCRCSARPAVPDWRMGSDSSTARGRGPESAEQVRVLQFKIPLACMFTNKVTKIWFWLQGRDPSLLLCMLLLADWQHDVLLLIFCSSYYSLRLEKINWYHFQDEHQTSSLQLRHDPRARLWFKSLLHQCVSGLVKHTRTWWSTVVLPELLSTATDLVFLTKRQQLQFVSKCESAWMAIGFPWWWFSFRCTSTNSL